MVTTSALTCLQMGPGFIHPVIAHTDTSAKHPQVTNIFSDIEKVITFHEGITPGAKRSCTKITSTR